MEVEMGGLVDRDHTTNQLAAFPRNAFVERGFNGSRPFRIHGAHEEQKRLTTISSEDFHLAKPRLV